MIVRTQLILTAIGITCFTLGCSSKKPEADTASQQRAMDVVRNEVQDVSSNLSALAGNVDASQKTLTAIEERMVALLGNSDLSRKRLIDLQEQIQKAPAAQLDEIEADFSALRTTLSTLEKIELTENLASVDWSIALRQSFSPPLTSVKLLEAEALMQHVPLSLAGSIADQFAEQLGAETVRFAEELSKMEPPDAEELGIVDELLDRIQATNGASENSISEIRKAIAKRLESGMQERDRSDLALQIDGIKNQHAAVAKIADADLRRSAIMGLSQSVEAMRIQRTIQGLDQGLSELAEIHKQLNTEVSTSLELLGNEQRTKLGKARMRYQAWALTEIVKMKDFLDDDETNAKLNRLSEISPETKEPVIVEWADFTGVRKLLQDGIGELAANRQLSAEQRQKIGPFVNDKWYELLYQVRHDAAVRHLLHIDQNLLEPPVAKFFSAAFEQLWTQLDDKKELQLSLAQKTAEIDKRSLENFMESKNE